MGTGGEELVSDPYVHQLPPAPAPFPSLSPSPSEPPLKSWVEGSAGGRPSGNPSEAVPGPRGTLAGPGISWRAELRQLPATRATSQEPVGLGRDTPPQPLSQRLHACSLLATSSFGAPEPPAPCSGPRAGRATLRPPRAGSQRFLPGAVGAGRGGIYAGAGPALAP